MSPDSLAELIDVGVADRVLPGEQESGDAHLMAVFDRGALIAVIDGLGHGPEAADAARLAREALRTAPSADLVTLIEHCHGALRRSRGVVMTLVRISLPGPAMTWLGVGNVEGRIVRGQTGRERSAQPRETVLLKGGVVGYQLPALRPSTLALHPGDTILLATDGLPAAALETLVEPSAGVQEQAEALLAAHARENDDALVLVARYRG